MQKILFCLGAFFFSFVSIAQELKPTEEEALVTFKVSDYEDIPEQDAEIILENTDLNFTKKLISDVDGIAQILLKEGKSYSLKVFKFGETFDFGILEIPEMKGPIKFMHKLKIRVVENYIRNYTLEDVYFETGSYDITSDSWVAMHKLLEALNFNPRMKVEIAGHTDSVGDSKANLNLSQRRAETLVKWLVKKGIPSDRLIAKGYGDKKPIADNTTEEGKAKNRRTELRIIEE
jgi:OOP family OmpA-OmpF porin